MYNFSWFDSVCSFQFFCNQLLQLNQLWLIWQFIKNSCIKTLQNVEIRLWRASMKWQLCAAVPFTTFHFKVSLKFNILDKNFDEDNFINIMYDFNFLVRLFIGYFWAFLRVFFLIYRHNYIDSSFSCKVLA